MDLHATFGGVDVAAARALLGVAPGASPEELRVAYRLRLRAVHPDLHGRDAGTAEVVAAYRVLREAGDDVVDPPSPLRGHPSSPVEHSTAVEQVAVVVDGDTVVADLPAGDLFGLLVEAGHHLGHVAYVDAASGLLEVIVEVSGYGACSAVFTLQGRAAGYTEAWCSVEPLGGGPAPSPATVAELLAVSLTAVSER
jgi:hypothetical protein